MQVTDEAHTHTEDYGYEEDYHPPQTPQAISPSAGQVTRTVAIIKNHALSNRFEIEPRIQAASFEIVKERQMEFDTETDPDTLYELFGEDADSLAEGPVWVYVLERRRAVEVWNTLMGDRDPEIARKESPNSLRALYGISRAQNGFMGSPDNHTAEIQIASLFVSSPPFPLSELPDDHHQYGSVSSVTSSALNALRRTFSNNDGYAHSNPSTHGGSSSKVNTNGKRLFRARPIPVTTIEPDIVPRTTRAAELRAGTVQTNHSPYSPSAAPRAPISKARQQETFANVPGHKRAEVIQVSSTAAPTIAPRMTRAASLRLGQKPTAPVRRSISNDEDAKRVFEGVPGHKRRETFSVASVKTPTVSPRLNKSASLRQTKDSAPPTSYMFKAPVAPKLPGLTRTNSQGPVSGRSSTQPTPPSRPSSQASMQPTTRSQPSRPSSAAAIRTTKAYTNGTNGHNGTSSTRNGNGTISPSTTAGGTSVSGSRLGPRPSSIGAPTIAPRTNRSAALRLAKKEAEEAAAAKKAGGRRPSAPPSSFKTVMA
ncbi:hypothetical protein BDN72DRAFT_774374 [Pluteus cervinus]|uniref:Uncharacterized protein n=1 Tax=Pluteus cervinus TaxID=181527 RepID=A0ACD3AG91_9AGAR|nr:hypothetical protein BDN72DRAFT_774374 [Pluteus cervinus]